MLDLLLNEDLWFPTAMAIGLLVVMALAFGQRKARVSRRVRVVCGLNLFYGIVIGIMGCGHLLAVTIKTALGTLPASTNPWFVLPLGLALTIPAWLLVASIGALASGERAARLRAMTLNAWLGVVFLIFGFPLAVAAAVNVVVLTRMPIPTPGSPSPL